jgi:hypothetical protein
LYFVHFSDGSARLDEVVSKHVTVRMQKTREERSEIWSRTENIPENRSKGAVPKKMAQERRASRGCDDLVRTPKRGSNDTNGLPSGDEEEYWSLGKNKCSAGALPSHCDAPECLGSDKMSTADRS